MRTKPPWGKCDAPSRILRDAASFYFGQGEPPLPYFAGIRSTWPG